MSPRRHPQLHLLGLDYYIIDSFIHQLESKFVLCIFKNNFLVLTMLVVSKIRKDKVTNSQAKMDNINLLWLWMESWTTSHASSEVTTIRFIFFIFYLFNRRHKAICILIGWNLKLGRSCMRSLMSFPNSELFIFKLPTESIF